MAATFKSRLEPDLSDPSVSQSPDHHHYMNGYPCIETNGSLVRSFSAEESEMSGLNGGRTFDRDIDFDDCSPPLKDVEALLRGYSQSPFEHEEENGQDVDDDDDFAEDGSSPILLSECPEFQVYLQPFETSNVSNDIDEDEIVFGFKSRRNGNSSKDKKEDEDALWKLIEAETEALCLSEEGLVRFQSDDAPQSPGKFPSKENKTSSTSKGGVAALMDCAATEMSRLRIKSTLLKRYAPQETQRSPEPSPSPPHLQIPHKINSQERNEKATSTTDTLTSLLQIQLAQINRMSETFSNQIAHERALLELLQLEHNRVKAEVKICESENDSAPTDLMSQFRHLKERLEQQKSLIDDLEYQYLEDKTKYEEEKESLIAQLKQQEETNSETPHKTGHLGTGEADVRREQSPEDAYTYPSSIFSSNVPHAQTISPICTPPAADSPLNFNGNPNNSSSIDNHREIFQSGNGIMSNGKNEVEVSREEVTQSMSLSSPRSVLSNNGDFSHFSPFMMSSSPVGHLRNTPVLQEQKTPSQLNSTPAYHQQNGRSMDETCYTRREDQNASPQTSSSFQGGGSNPHTTTTSSSSSLLPSGRDLQQSSCASFSNNVFHAVPPLLSSLSANADNRQWSREDPVSSRYNEEVRIRQRQRTSSAVSRQCWQDNEVRPLTRYLPVPDDISFDLRHHLEVTCGHILCSPLLIPHLHVDATTCAGYLYKVDSRVTFTSNNNSGDTATKNSKCDKSSSLGVNSALTTSTFFSPSTKRAKMRPPRVNSPNIGNGNGGGFMAALFNRSRRGKRRWFVLDRRRRLLIYYSCHTSKSSSAASLLKPKDVISFTDIIDVYPDRQGRKGNSNKNSSFCLLLVASCPSLSSINSPQCRSLPTRTRTLSLTAPSPEAMRVWVDALFTCAGAYLCLPDTPLSNQRRDASTKDASNS